MDVIIFYLYDEGHPFRSIHCLYLVIWKKKINACSMEPVAYVDATIGKMFQLPFSVQILLDAALNLAEFVLNLVTLLSFFIC